MKSQIMKIRTMAARAVSACKKRIKMMMIMMMMMIWSSMLQMRAELNAEMDFLTIVWRSMKALKRLMKWN
jgi:hypothetical protein